MRQIVPMKLCDILTKITRFEKKHFQKDSYKMKSETKQFSRLFL